MPNFDGTGPQGQGAMSGRQRGGCRNIKTPQTTNSENQPENKEEVFYGLGRGGNARGGGMRNRFRGGNRQGRSNGKGSGGGS
ncbi:MAG: DUF5320 domain-containing protein [Ignavibacteriaceae bacterium]|nr:DUF5320 domain-containing protein [Ignavibacteriaceae bacterium]